MEEGFSNFCIRSRSCYGGGAGGGGTKCGRWNPTAEQIKVLTDLFRSGLRTPSTDQIQKISTQLSFYGKIESKNVFYWFQNHKARERQKRRRVSVADEELLKENICEEKKESSTISSQTNEVAEAEKVKETLQLFPLNSNDELYSDKMRLFTSDQNKGSLGNPLLPYNTTWAYEMHPTLDLRLSFF